MRCKLKLLFLILKTIQVTCIFSFAIAGLVVILDFLLPLFLTMLQDPIRRGWCGIFARCASKSAQTFVEFLWSGEPWKSLSFAAIKIRVLKGSFVGVIAGFVFAVISFACMRR